MNLLDDEDIKRKKNKSNAQKIVLVLIILAVVLSLIVGALLFLMQNTKQEASYSIAINGSLVPLSDLGVFQAEDKSIYLSIKALCDKINYNYYNGEYNIAEENKEKGYVSNKTGIVQFFTDSNEIYKTNENDEKDYQYFKLKNKILKNNDLLCIDIEDLPLALNLIYSYSSEYNRSIIITPEYWISSQEKDLAEKGYMVSATPQNIKALSYGYIVVGSIEKDNFNTADSKFGVLNISKEEIIGCKYNSLTFIEKNLEFIAANSSNKFGIIDKEGTTVVDLQYDDIKILNYDPLLFKVEKLDTCGIMKEDGSILDRIKYTSIGYPAEERDGIAYTLIIPELNENIPESIVVCQNGKYGLLDLETGEKIIPCSLSGIFLYINKEDLKEYYIVRLEDGKTMDYLEDYVASLNGLTVTMDN